jgi:HEAT repeat protein
MIAALALLAPGCRSKSSRPPPDAAPAAKAPAIKPQPAPRPRPHLPVSELESPDAERRLRAVRSFARKPPTDAKVIADLIDLLSSDRPDVRLSAATALTYVSAPEAAEPLAKALADPDPLVAFQAVKALARRGDPAALPGVLETLGSGDVKRRTWAVQAFGTLGDPARPHWKKLVPLLADPSEAVRLQAIRAIGRLGDRTAIEPLVEAAQESSGLLRVQIRLALGDLDIDAAARQEALARIPR